MKPRQPETEGPGFRPRPFRTHKNWGQFTRSAVPCQSPVVGTDGPAHPEGRAPYFKSGLTSGTWTGGFSSGKYTFTG